MKIPAALANVIVVLVTLVWAGNFAAGLFLPDYRSDPSLNFVFMTIVGGALALRAGADGEGLVARLLAALHSSAVPPGQPPPGPPPPAPAATAPEDRAR